MNSINLKWAMLILVGIAVVVQFVLLSLLRVFDSAAAGALPWGSLLATSALSAVVVVAVAWVFGVHYARRAETLVDVMHRLAEGDLTQKAKIPGKDEFSWLAWEYDCARKALFKFLTNLVRQSGEVGEAARQTADASASITERTHQQSAAAASIAASVQEMAVGTAHVTESMFQARQLAVDAEAEAERGTGVIGNVMDEVGNIATAVRHASTVVDDLGRQSTQIQSIVKVIDDVAGQTNLLALNAAIEAARAGEQGRGFAVVADEVRKLAERTSKATQEIRGMIESIAKGTAEAVASMQQSVAQLERGVALAGEAGKAIATINASTHKVASTIAAATDAVAEQRGAADEIARHVEEIARIAESNSEATRQMGTTANTMADLARDLKAATGQFKL